MSDEINKPQPKKESEENGCLPPIISLCVLLFISYIISTLEKNSPGAGRDFLWYAFMSAIVGIVLYLVIGRTVKATATNLMSMTKGVVKFLLIIGVIG